MLSPSFGPPCVGVCAYVIGLVWIRAVVRQPWFGLLEQAMRGPAGRAPLSARSKDVEARPDRRRSSGEVRAGRKAGKAPAEWANRPWRERGTHNHGILRRRMPWLWSRLCPSVGLNRPPSVPGQAFRPIRFHRTCASRVKSEGCLPITFLNSYSTSRAIQKAEKRGDSVKKSPNRFRFWEIKKETGLNRWFRSLVYQGSETHTYRCRRRGAPFKSGRKLERGTRTLAVRR